MEEKVSQTQAIVNRAYKDTLFRMLFREKQNLYEIPSYPGSCRESSQEMS